MRNSRKVISLVLAATMAVSLLAGCGSSTASSAAAPSAAPQGSSAAAPASNPVQGKKVAYVMLLPSATIFQMWKDSCAKLCDELGVQFDFFFCDGDFNKWQDTIRTCASAGYDGLLVSHGNQDGSYVFLKEITEQYPDL